MTPIAEIAKGEAIRAGWLNQIVGQANRVEGALGAPSARIGQRGASPWALPCVVVGRELTPTPGTPDGAYPLHAIAYRLSIPGLAPAVDAPWTKRIAGVQPSLLGPNAPGDQQLFWPAAVIDTPEADREPYRAYGTVHITAYEEADGTPRWFVDLFGESAYRGC